MASIFSLYGSIYVDNEKANKAIDETTNKGKQSSSTLTEKLGSAMKTVAKIGTAVVAGTTAAVGGMTALANSTASAADEIDKGSIRMGVTTKAYQELRYAAGQCGVEMTAMEKAAKKLEGTDMNMEDAMNQIMALGTAEERATKAAELFGDNIAYTLSPLIEQSAESYTGLIDNANELGLIMGEDAVAAGVLLGDTMSDVTQSLGAAKNEIGSALMPVIQTVLELIIQNLPTIRAMFSSIAPVLTQLLQSALPPLIQLAQTLLPAIIDLINLLLPFIGQIIEALLPVIIQLLETLLPPIIQIVELILPLLIKLLEPLLPLLEPIFQLLQPLIDLLMALIMPLVEILDLILPPLIKLITSIIELILPGLNAGLTAAAGIIKAVFGGALDYIKNQFTVVKNVFSNIIDFIKNVFTGNWKAAWENVKNIFKSIAEGLGNIFKAPINFIIDIINGFIGGLNKIKIPDWVPGVGGKGINIPLIKKLRVGMEYVPYDEMPAILHKGEAVLTAEENRRYQESISQSSSATPAINYDELEERMSRAFVQAFTEFNGVIKVDDTKLGDYIISKVEEVVY